MPENYNTFQLLTIISVVASIISGICAAIAVIYSHRATKIAKEANHLNKLSFDRESINKITDIREGFHSDVLKIREDFPTSIELPLSKCSVKQKKALNTYWEIVFREYRTCKVGIPEMEELWDSEFRLQSFRALKWLSFREGLEELIKHKQKSPINKEIISELKQVMSESIEHYQ